MRNPRATVRRRARVRLHLPGVPSPNRRRLLTRRSTSAAGSAVWPDACGGSTGSPDEEGTYRDGRAVYDYLVNTRHVDPARLVLMGESLGCAISIQLAIERKAAGLVIEAPFASIAHMANAIYPFLPLGSF